MQPTDQTREEHCERHGPYTSTIWRFGTVEHWTGCLQCSDERKEAERDRELADAASNRKQALEDARTALRYQRAKIPQRYVGKTFDTYQVDHANAGQDRALKICRAYVERWEQCRKVGRCIVFVGTVGTGKSHLAAAICSGVLEKGATALFRTAPDAIGMVKAEYGKGGDEESAYEALRKPDLLVLDDIGAVKLSEHDLGVLYRIIQGRYEDEKPLIMTSNAPTIAVLQSIIGDRLVDRAVENNGVELVMSWASNRRGK